MSARAARRGSARGRIGACAAAGVVCLLVSAPAPRAARAGPGSGAASVRASQELVTLHASHRAFAAPGTQAARRTTLAARRPITGAPTVLPVLEHATVDGSRWLRVRLPGRPNGATGWIAARGTSATSTVWHVVVRTASRRARVYRAGRLARSFAVVVGKPATPTPHGRFFVEESVRMARGDVGGPYALATSARSNVLQEFAGGPGQIALHGVANLGGTPGSAVSHGCIRMTDADDRWMAARIGPGVPVTITR